MDGAWRSRAARQVVTLREALDAAEARASGLAEQLRSVDETGVQARAAPRPAAPRRPTCTDAPRLPPPRAAGGAAV